MDALEKAVITEIVSRRLRGEEDLFYTMTCRNTGWEDNASVYPPCGQKFKFLRGCGGSVICPKCGMRHDPSDPELAKALRAIPVD